MRYIKHLKDAVYNVFDQDASETMMFSLYLPRYLPRSGNFYTLSEALDALDGLVAQAKNLAAP